MVFKKPYAFLIKYFRAINLVLAILLIYFSYRLNILRLLIKDVYLVRVTNYSTLKSDYIGFKMYFILFLTIALLTIILILLHKKKKPVYDYLYNLIYLVFTIVYLLSVSGMFLQLDNSVVELTTLKIYTDISLLIIAPNIYFIVKYILITIGFNLKKFNFTKDIVELKQEEKDNEEVEIIFDKNSYKYKRGIRRIIRELKYYFLENRFFITIILGVVIIILMSIVLSANIFNSNKVKLNKYFSAGGFNYEISNIYETKYDYNNNIIDKNYKFVILKANVNNILNESASIDFKRIRLIYGKEYSYANNYFNKFFYDLGKPYNSEALKPNDTYNYIFIFKVPSTYKLKKYKIKFYDRVIYENNESNGSYKVFDATAKDINNKQSINTVNYNENIVLNKRSFGNTNITISNIELKSSYTYTIEGTTNIIKDKDINKALIVIDYKLELDDSSEINKYFKADRDFFDKFLTVSYIYNDIENNDIKVSCIKTINGKAFISVPYNALNSTSIKLNIELRSTKLVYTVK